MDAQERINAIQALSHLLEVYKMHNMPERTVELIDMKIEQLISLL